MQNYKLTIAYDGTRFFGWERQPDRDTVQGKIEAVLSRLAGKPVEIIGAGRTDAGVHARAMVANAVLDVKESPEEIRAGGKTLCGQVPRPLQRFGQNLSLYGICRRGKTRF